MAASRFGSVEDAPPIEVFALSEAYKSDPFEKKVSLGVGAYRTDQGQPWVLPVVREAEKQMAENAALNHEYLPITGNPDFVKESCKLVLGDDSTAIAEGRADGAQGLGGTGCIYVGAAFLRKLLGYNTWYISSPTWGNHRGIAKNLNYDVKEYRYWDPQTRTLDINGMVEDLKNAPPNSVIVLHACAHNPTGVDATPDQWKMIADVCEQKNLFPFFDIAYQGFSTGDLEKDAYSVRYFVERGFECLVSQSFSKNFGLYNERVGNLCFVTKDAANKEAIKSQLKMIIRQTYSNPPNHGGRIVATVLGNPAMKAQWKNHVGVMAGRIIEMRKQLFERLTNLKTPGVWEHIITQTGMFSYTGLTVPQVEYLKSKYHIYMLKSGRINMCGLTSGNIDYVAHAFDDAVRNH
ncbi:aspartate aminotransferase, cytoplasmic-like [Lineus longissimus]|uniref:aspartate aminotransferase, cytoplasmic-like n=1 Tax=Lineus longissimus TaxID=88925 RepID=UPI002B4E7D6D